MVDVAEARIWGRRVGAVAWDEGSGLGSFEYAESFRRSGLELSPLMMPLGPAIYRFPELRTEAFRGLPGLLADSLPDRWGTTLVDTWLELQGRARESFNPVERLCYVGTRGMGALEFRPAMRGMGRSEQLEVDSLVDLARDVLAMRAGQSVALDDEGLAALLQVGTSAGGVRAKAVIAWNPETNETRSGQVTAPEGFQYWIIKFDGVGSTDGQFTDPKGYGRVEYAYHSMATEAGIDMAEARLHLDAEGRAHFMTRRFDRTDTGEKIHAQTLQALAHLDYNRAGAHSWETALRLTRQLCGAADVERLYRRMVFDVVARNQDDHTKNISFLMGPDGRWSLSPGYDLTWAHNPASMWTASHQMTIAGKRDAIARSDLIQVGDGAGVRRPDDVVGEVLAAVRRWPEFSTASEVPVDLHEAVSASLRLDI